MLSALRCMLQENSSGDIEWRGGFPAVLKLWDEVGSRLMRVTLKEYNAHEKSVIAVGRDSAHWGLLHNIVKSQIK